MITSLSKLTMRKYIELVCGDTSVLCDPHEIVVPEELRRIRKTLIYEYARLSDDAGSKLFVADHTTRAKAKSELVLFKCLNNMVAFGAFDDVRTVLRDYGIVRTMDDGQVVAEVTRLLKRARTNIKRYEEQKTPDDDRQDAPDEIRAQFDRQAASLMTYFKFQINYDTIPASQFACLIDQAHKQIKAQMAALNKK